MKDMIIIGDGLGVRTFAASSYGLDVLGTDISQYAIDNSLYKQHMILDDIVNTNIEERAKLVVAYDILEHIDYKKLNKTIDNLIKISNKHILISVPVLGDPNLEQDPTHIIKEDKKWWIKKFTDKGLKLIPTPSHFLFKEQIMIFEK